MANRLATRPYRVLVVEDHPLVRLGLSTLLDDHPELALCAEADCEHQAWALAEAIRPDVAIIDLGLKSGDGLDLIRRLRAKRPEIEIVVSSMQPRAAYERRALSAGARAFVPKDRGVEELLCTVRDAALRGPEPEASPSTDEDAISRGLSDRELEVFRLIGEGLSTREIAAQLCRSVKTIETHKGRLRQKLEIRSASQLARAAALWSAGETASRSA